MSVVVGASAHGSPGVTTALQLIAALWPQPEAVPVLVEADATGGVLAARFELSFSPGMVSLAESLRKLESPPLLDHAQRLPSGVACVPLSASATAASAQLRSAGGFLGTYLRDCPHPVLVDAGTLVPDSRIGPVVVAADLMVWFVRPTRDELFVLRHRLAECPQPDNAAVVLVGDTPYGPAEVESALGIEVVHVLPVDARAATALNLGGDDRYLRRSALARSCRRLAELLRNGTWDAVLAGDGARPAEPAVAEGPIPSTASEAEHVSVQPIPKTPVSSVPPPPSPAPAPLPPPPLPPPPPPPEPQGEVSPEVPDAPDVVVWTADG